MAEMEVEIVPAHSAEELAAAANRVARVLAAGGLVIHPTETVYGIGGDGSEQNNQLIGLVKQREEGQSLIVLTPGLDVLRAACAALEWSEAAEKLAKQFWPGPLTLIVGCTGAPKSLVGVGGGLAVRVSPHPVVAAVLKRWGRPMTSTSANLTGAVPAQTVERALEVFANRDDLDDLETLVVAVDAGPSQGARPSTIVSLVEWPPRLIREGPLTREEIQKWLPELS
jgi:L-threonylcarbamoyladenylate synthase